MASSRESTAWPGGKARFRLLAPEVCPPPQAPEGLPVEEWLQWPRLPVAHERAKAAPAFRFMFGARDGAVVPHGCLTSFGLVRRLHEGWVGAAGDVLALDTKYAQASFAYVQSATRGQAEEHLRRWARADGWRLEIRPGSAPLLATDPWRATVAVGGVTCPSCGAPWSRELEGKRFHALRYVRTQCTQCAEGRIAPCGLVRCPTCREARGWVIEGDFGEVCRLGAACMCEGSRCQGCGNRLVRKLGSNHFDEQTGTVWHTPYFAGWFGCEHCRSAE